MTADAPKSTRLRGTVMTASLVVRNSALHDSDHPFIDLPLELDPPIGELEYVRLDDDGIHHLRYLPPDEFPPGEVIEVRAAAISDSGLRHPSNNPPPRSSALFITGEPAFVRVAPSTACVENGESQQFQAIDPDTGSTVEVDWIVDGIGSISQTGLYTAPAFGTASDVLIRAVGPSNTEFASVSVGSCACVWNARLSGTPVVSDGLAGPAANMGLTYNDTHYTGIDFFGESLEGETGLMFRFDPPLPIGATGSATTTASLVRAAAGCLAFRSA